VQKGEAMQTWEHKVLDIATRPLEAQRLLDAEGDAGWELVAVVPQSADAGTGACLAFLKRPREATRAPEGPASHPEETPAADGLDVEAGFSVVLIGISGEKASVVVAVAQACPWLHLKDAKRLVDSPPGVLAARASEEDARVLAAQLLEAGAIVEVRASTVG
jgi:ribosomal protein L7/L12